jgi:hypothetical protein
MLARLFTLVAALLAPVAMAQNGPSSLYTLLNGMTFNPPGYTIVMYQSCVQNQNAGNPCGSFSGFQSAGGQYTHMLYGPEAPVSPTCSRTFKLALACGPTLAMSGVNENPTCVYSATLSLPQVCGVDLTVGNEVASVSPTALPPTSSPTTTLTLTATATVTTSTTTTLTATPTTTLTATSTPLFQITAWPTTTATSTLTATSTPLYMITAWPSPSPVNVSATSTPLYYYTAYPSIVSNATGGGGLLGLASSLTEGSSSTAVILGSVALGIVGLGAAAGAVAYFRKGGSVNGLMDKINSGKGTLTQFANALPISEAEKAKLRGAISDPSSLLPEKAQAAIHQAQEKAEAVLHQVQGQAQAAVEKAEALKEQAHAIQSQVLQVLPPSFGEAILAKEAALTQHVQGLAQQAKAQVLQVLPPVIAEQVQAHVLQVLPQAQAPIEQKVETVLTFAPVPVQSTPVAETPPPEVAHIAVSADQVEAIKTFLEQKAAAEAKN